MYFKFKAENEILQYYVNMSQASFLAGWATPDSLLYKKTDGRGSGAHISLTPWSLSA